MEIPLGGRIAWNVLADVPHGRALAVTEAAGGGWELRVIPARAAPRRRAPPPRLTRIRTA